MDINCIRIQDTSFVTCKIWWHRSLRESWLCIPTSIVHWSCYILWQSLTIDHSSFQRWRILSQSNNNCRRLTDVKEKILAALRGNIINALRILSVYYISTLVAFCDLVYELTIVLVEYNHENLLSTLLSTLHVKTNVFSEASMIVFETRY